MGHVAGRVQQNERRRTTEREQDYDAGDESPTQPAAGSTWHRQDGSAGRLPSVWEGPLADCETVPVGEQAGRDLHFAWGETGRSRAQDGADVVVVVDVLSFCTCVDVAVSRGATVMAWATSERFAAEWAARHQAVLAVSERSADHPSLSPASLSAIAPGTRLVLPSPNGALLTRRAASGAATVFAGCLRNAAAVATAAASVTAGRVLVVAAGERWPDGSLRPALEDLVGAGSVLARLPGTLSPEAAAAVAVYRDMDVRGALSRCESALELCERGFGQDVELALEADCSETAPVIRPPDGFFAGF